MRRRAWRIDKRGGWRGYWPTIQSSLPPPSPVLRSPGFQLQIFPKGEPRGWWEGKSKRHAVSRVNNLRYVCVSLMCMCFFIRLRVCVCFCACTFLLSCVCVCFFIRLCVCLFLRLYVLRSCACVSSFVYVCVCLFLHLYVSAVLCMCVYFCVYACICASTDAFPSMRMRDCIRMYLYAGTYAYTNTCICSWVPTPLPSGAGPAWSTWTYARGKLGVKAWRSELSLSHIQSVFAFVSSSPFFWSCKFVRAFWF